MRLPLLSEQLTSQPFFPLNDLDYRLFSLENGGTAAYHWSLVSNDITSYIYLKIKADNRSFFRSINQVIKSVCQWVMLHRTLTPIQHSHLTHLCYHVLQVDCLCPTDWGRSMIVDQLVQRVELDYPEKVLSCPVPKDLEVLNTTTKPGCWQRTTAIVRAFQRLQCHTAAFFILNIPEPYFRPQRPSLQNPRGHIFRAPGPPFQNPRETFQQNIQGPRRWRLHGDCGDYFPTNIFKRPNPALLDIWEL